MTQEKTINVPRDVQEIYQQWADGPSADEYYNAVARYFAAKHGSGGDFDVDESFHNV